MQRFNPRELLRLHSEGVTIPIGNGYAFSNNPGTSQTIKFEDDKKPDIKRLEKGTDYAIKYKQTEDRRLFAASFALYANNEHPTKRVKIDDGDEVYDEMTLALGGGIDMPSLPELTVYDRYQFDIPSLDLPIRNKKDEILDQINKNMFIVLTANTGTGKSTQIPQYILEDAKKSRQKCNIVVTQPKRIAAISVAKRVAIERNCECGTLVGYQVGSEKLTDSQANSDTRILFCTTGVLLQKLVNEKSLKNFTHVIVDEIHERDINIDMLLIVLRRLVATKNPNVKIILMSATMNSEKLSNYFVTYKPDDDESSSSPAPVLNLNVMRPFKIRYDYLDSLENIGNTEGLVDVDKPGISNDLYKFALKTMIFMIYESRRLNINPSFLVFLPGLYEIEKFKRELYKSYENFNVSEFRISLLHSQISDDFRGVCDENVDNRIILSTNIAESSVTLPGIRYVIDFCLTKYKETDTASNSTKLKLDWASQNSLHQRAGRVGRMQSGQVVRLVHKDHFDKLEKETRPEIKRVSLEFAVLKTKQLDLGRPAAVLALALDPPDKKCITDAIITLKEIGALTRFDKSGKFSSKDGDLTPVGQIMSTLPVDVRVAKLIVLGYMFRCLKDCIIMGVGMNYRSIFTLSSSDAKRKMEEYNQKLEFSKGSASDPIAILNAYNQWQDMMEKTDSCSDPEEKSDKRRIWCRTLFLNMKNLLEMQREIEDIKNRLSKQKLKCNDFFPYNDEKKCIILKMCLAGAFYPNYFSFGGDPPLHEDFKEMNSLNPCNVVYFKGLKQQDIMKLYKNQIVDILYEMGVTDDTESIKLRQNSISQRVFVEFKSHRNEENKCVPGMVKSEVYRALKLRKLDYDIEIRVMKDKINETKLALKSQRKFIKKSKYCIYPENISERGRIIHIVDCGKFFFQPARAEFNLQELTKQIEQSCRQVPMDRKIGQGSLMFVLYNGSIRRAKVLETPDPEDLQNQDCKYEVRLVDLGATVEIDKSDFYEMDGADINNRLMELMFEFPPQCYECRLSAIIPSPIKCSYGWSEESTKKFHLFIQNKNHAITVKSFVDHIASVEVYVEDHQEYSGTLNDKLVNEGFALSSDDSYIQQCNQITRESLQTDETSIQDYEDEFAEEENFLPPSCLLDSKVKLEGPMTVIENSSVDKLASLVSNKTCLIEPLSVNSVLIDPYPFDTSTKVLVAASLVDKENNLQLCQTTILPHVPGMATLAALIFAPIVEIRLNTHKNRVANILCGLGGSQHGDKMKSIFGEHDIFIRNDIALDNNDLKNINSLRNQMSSILQFREMEPEQSEKSRDDVVRTFIDILSEKRRLFPIILGTDPDLEKHWKLHQVKQEKEILYPPHFLPEKLVPLKQSVRQKLKDNSEKEKKDFLEGKTEHYKCKLCNHKEFKSTDDLKIHSLTTFHCDRLMQLRDETTPM